MNRHLYLFVAFAAISISSLAVAGAYEECKKTDSEEQVIKCIEKGTWDPCDEGGGPNSWVGAQCGTAHAEIAARKLKAVETTISNRLHNAGRTSIRSKFLSSQKQWRTFANNYCSFVNEADDSALFTKAGPYYLRYNFCMKRLTTERLNELTAYIQ